MSWDFHITSKRCPTCGRWEYFDEAPVQHSNNYTSNMWPMLKQAGFHWDDIEGKPCREAFPLLDNLVKELKSAPEVYRQLNPKNGWGEYDSFLDWLTRMTRWVEKSPDGFIHVSR